MYKSENIEQATWPGDSLTGPGRLLLRAAAPSSGLRNVTAAFLREPSSPGWTKTAARFSSDAPGNPTTSCRPKLPPNTDARSFLSPANKSKRTITRSSAVTTLAGKARVDRTSRQKPSGSDTPTLASPSTWAELSTKEPSPPARFIQATAAYTSLGPERN